MSNFAKQLGKRIRDTRLRRGLTQGELAERVKVGQTLVSHIESGIRTGSVSTLAAIADELAVSLDELLDRGSSSQPAGPVVDRLLAAVGKCSAADLALLAEMAETMAHRKNQGKTSARKRSPRR